MHDKIIVQTAKALFVGPDNGLLMLAAKNQGIEKVYEIRNPRYIMPKISRTFHGRDIFAPTAAHLANGISPKEFGPEIKDYIIPEYTKPIIKKDGIIGEILHIDDFGNLITNISEETFAKIGLAEGDLIKLTFKDKNFKLKICEAYGKVGEGKLLAIIGSHNLLEFSINRGNAANYLCLRIGEKFHIKKLKKSK
ncbi:hypothetical protein DRO54_09020 [Candidatus Bathyarchaeota archaeon]|nr:MAG: hypothetical protein DRO54_09020 [Candidatus Bathyarchaeota archaeon]